jgi:hypothetical protein
MSLVPSSSGSSNPLSLQSLRNALMPLKAALDERDNWELLAHADEKQRVAALPKTAALRRSGARRGGGLVPQRPPRIPRSLGRQLFITKSVQNATVATNTVYVSNYVSITLSNDPNAASYTSVFDLYWIVKVRFSMVNLAAPGSVSALPVVILVPEFTGATPSWSAIQGYEKAKERILSSGRKISLSVSPRFLSTQNGSNSPISQATWLNCTTTTVPWYGVSYSINAQPAGNPNTLETVLEVWTAFCNGD